MEHKKNKVVVAMSGGVDSSLSASLLKKQGFELIGLFMRLGAFGQEKSEAAARAVCRHLGIRFYPINLSLKFKQEIINYFLRAYQSGLTPNPCVKCNRVIKFKELLRIRRELGAEYLATGHYVRLFREGNIFKLYRPKDKEKDQTYFLYNLKQEQLKHILFPLGEYQKKDVRGQAKRENLPFLINESQDICFLSQDGKILDHNKYLKKHLKLRPGPIKTMAGDKIGEHEGLPLYTIGQRRGIEIGGTGPYYAARADYKTNTLYVVNNTLDPALFKDELAAGKLNWISGIEPKFPLNCSAAIRYRHKDSPCSVQKLKINKKNYQYIVKFKTPERAVTPGQSVVFYSGEELLGGGTIEF